jgi:WD40 repeat protein
MNDPSGLPLPFILASLLLMGGTGLFGDAVHADDATHESVPANTCIVNLTLPSGATVAVDGRDYGEERTLRFSPLNPGATYQSKLVCRFADGHSEQRMFLIRGGHREHVALQPPSRTVPRLAVQAGHSQNINVFAFHPSGKQVLTGSGDGTAKLWDIASGHCVREFPARGAGVISGAFSRDGTRLVLGSWHSTATVWDVAKCERIQTLRIHEWKWGYDFALVALSPNGELTVTGDESRKSLLLWDNRTGEVRRTYSLPSPVATAEFSPDGRHLLACSSTEVILWSTTTPQRIRTYPHSDTVESASFAPDGRCVLTNTGSRLTLWKADSSERVRSFDLSSRVIHRAAISPDGKQLWGVSADGKGALWEVATGRRTATLVGYDGGPAPEAISPKGYALAGLLDGTAVVWDLITGDDVLHTPGGRDRVRNDALSPNGRFLLVGGERQSLWDLSTGQHVRAYENAPFNTIAYSRDGQYLLAGFDDGTARLCTTENGETVQTLAGHAEPVHSVAMSSDGRRALTGSADGWFLWDLVDALRLHQFEEFEGPTPNLVLSPDGRHAMSASPEAAYLYDAQTGRLLHEFKGHEKPLNMAAFDSRGRYALTGGCDRRAILWDLDSYRQVHTFRGYRNGVLFVDFCASDRYVLVGSCDTTASLWEVETGIRLQHFEGHSGCVESAAMTPDERHVVTCSRDGSARIWEVATGRELARLTTINDGQDWLVTTPEGLFDGSLPARERIYYQIGDAMDVVPVDRFFQDFYCPGLLAAIWNGERPMPEIEMGQQLPPTLRIVSHELDGSKATIVAEVTEDGGGTQGPWIHQNGTRVLATQDTRRDGEAMIHTFRLDLVEGENEIEIKAACSDGSWESEPERVTLTYQKALPEPELYVLSVGINDYAEASFNLDYAAPDAHAFAQLFADRAPHSYGGQEHVHIREVVNDQATRQGILQAMKEIAEQAKTQDVFVMLLAGHGEMVGQRYYFLPHDFRRGDNISDSIRATGVPQDALNDAIAKMPLKRVVIYDTCKSGGALGGRSRNGVSFAKAIESSARAQGSYMITAAPANAEAQEIDQLGHGILTYALLAAAGAVDTGPLASRTAEPTDSGSGNGLAIRDWLDYAENNVPPLMVLYFGRKQFVETIRQGDNFVLLSLPPAGSQ